MKGPSSSTLALLSDVHSAQLLKFKLVIVIDEKLFKLLPKQSMENKERAKTFEKAHLMQSMLDFGPYIERVNTLLPGYAHLFM